MQDVMVPARAWQAMGEMASYWGHTWGGFNPLDPMWQAALIAAGCDSSLTDHPTARQVDAAVRHRCTPGVLGWGITSPGVRELPTGEIALGHVTGTGRYGWDVIATETGLRVIAEISRPPLYEGGDGRVFVAEYSVDVCDADDDGVARCPHKLASDGSRAYIMVRGQVSRTTPDGACYNPVPVYLRHVEYLERIVRQLVSAAVTAVRAWAESADCRLASEVHQDDSLKCRDEAYTFVNTDEIADRLDAARRAVEDARDALARAQEALAEAEAAPGDLLAECMVPG